jgi:hypothetical protein
MPSAVRHRTWSELAQRLHQLPDAVTVVSVDVFETLLLRRVDAESVTEASERELVRRLRQLGREPVLDPGPARFEAFTRAAERNAALGLDFCASLAEALPLWVADVAGPSFVPPEGFIDRMEEYEWRCERGIVGPNPPLIPWLRRVRNRAERVVFTSDMHLSTDRISALLQHVGYRDLFDAGYVSSDEGVRKVTGRLYTRVTEAEGVSPESILHVGDSLEVDGLRAAERGWRAHVVEDRRRRREIERHTADRVSVSLDGRFGGPVAAEAAAAAAPPVRASDEDITWRLLGAILSTFALRVAERCRDLGVRRLYFLSREGHCIKAVYERVEQLAWPDGGGPPATYLGVSRLSTLLAGARSYDLRVLEAAVRNHRHPTVRTLLGPFGFSEDVVRDRARLYGLDDLDAPLPHDPWWFSPLQRLLSDRVLAEMIATQQRTAEVLLADYLENESFFEGGRVSFVDIGWTGQIQDHLVHAIGHRPGMPQVVGLYLGVRRSASARHTDMSYSEGLLADERVIDWGQQAVFRFPQGLEELLRAPHGTVIGYTRDGEGIARPLLRGADSVSRLQESVDEQRTAPLQHALLGYADAWAASCEVLGVRGRDLLPYGRACLDRLFRMPREDERRTLTELSNVCDLGMEVVVPLASGEASGPRWRSVLSLRSRLRWSFWLHGTVHSTLGRVLAAPVVAALEAFLAPGRSVPTLPSELHHGSGGAPKGVERISPPPTSPTAEIESEASARREQVAEAAVERAPGSGPPIRPPGLGAAVASSLIRLTASAGCRLLGRHPYRADLVPLRLWFSSRIRRLTYHVRWVKR